MRRGHWALAWLRSAPSVVIGLCVVMGWGLVGCASTTVHLKSDEIPTSPSALPAPVDVCRLLTPDEIATAVGEHVRVVGVALQAPRVPTLECQWGKEFSAPLVSVDVAAGAVSHAVFKSAYGPRLGGDPVLIDRLGDAAYFRTGKDAYTLNVHLPTVVLTMSVARSTSTSIAQRTIADLARTAGRRLPVNPRLVVPPMRDRCRSVPVDRITAAVGQPPVARTSFRVSDGSMICTWSSRPGLLRVVLHRDHDDVSRLQGQLDPANSQDIDLGMTGWRAASQTDVAGDLLALGGRDLAIEIQVIPTSGWADSSILATDAEVELAKAVAQALS